MNSKYVVVYGIVQDTEKDGVFFDYPYLAGILDSASDAEKLAVQLTSDKSMQGTVMPRIYNLNGEGLEGVRLLATKHFGQQAREMYDVEEQQQRREKRRK